VLLGCCHILDDANQKTMVLLTPHLVHILLFRLASLGVTFVLDHLIFDPLLSLILGNTRFYRLRGYFYNFALGQEYKEIEE